MGIDDYASDELFDLLMEYLDYHSYGDVLDVLYQAAYIKTDEIYKDNTYISDSIVISKMSEVVEYCSTHVIPDNCGRYNNLLKNIAIWCIELGLSDKKISKLERILEKNFVNFDRKNALTGWVKWAREKDRNINISEVMGVLRNVKKNRD